MPDDAGQPEGPGRSGPGRPPRRPVRAGGFTWQDIVRGPLRARQEGRAASGAIPPSYRWARTVLPILAALPMTCVLVGLLTGRIPG
ncbi:MAG: hypothetical protein QG608_1414 [Actinomycetota bacterium]|nr:hypothetical protein [Actinomycetota bacterium]